MTISSRAHLLLIGLLIVVSAELQAQTKVFEYLDTESGSFGRSLSMSGDGNRIVIGVSDAENGNGKAILFEFDGTNWSVSKEFKGDVGNRFGEGVAISSDGIRIAISEVGGSGQTRIFVYQYREGVWENLGDPILIPKIGNQHILESYLDFGDEGMVLAVARPKYVANILTRLLRVYSLEGRNWTQVGQELSTGTDEIAWDIWFDLSLDGKTLAFNGEIFDFDGTSWISKLDLSTDDVTANEVNLSLNGTRAIHYQNSEKFVVFDIVGQDTIQVGQDLNGKPWRPFNHRLSENGKRLALYQRRGLTGALVKLLSFNGHYWREDASQIPEEEFEGTGVRDIEFSDDGYRLAFTSSGRATSGSDPTNYLKVFDGFVPVDKEESNLKQARDFVLFPNPVKRGLPVRSVVVSDGEYLEVTDVLGKRIIEKEITPGANVSFSTSSLSPGFYLAYVRGSNNIQRSSFVVN